MKHEASRTKTMLPSFPKCWVCKLKHTFTRKLSLSTSADQCSVQSCIMQHSHSSAAHLLDEGHVMAVHKPLNLTGSVITGSKTSSYPADCMGST